MPCIFTSGGRRVDLQRSDITSLAIISMQSIFYFWVEEEGLIYSTNDRKHFILN